MKTFYLLILVSASQGLLLQKEWDLFKKTHGKFYSDPREEEYRMNIFNQNKLKIDEHNKKYEQGLVFHFLKLNHFSDMVNNTQEELMFIKNDRLHTKKLSGALFVPSNSSAVPDSLDWRKKGAVTDVKYQWLCASWPFSAIGALESHNFIKTGILVPLSEQQLIDCSRSYGNKGCITGSAENAFNYAANSGGIDTAKSYPFLKGLELFCRTKKNRVAAKSTGYVTIPEGDEEALKNAVATAGPVSIAMDTTNFDFTHYGGGIYYNVNCTTTNLVQSMLIVGYDRQFVYDQYYDYWIVKNSYGKSWGENGYLRVVRNKNNQCGIASRATYPVMQEINSI